MILLFLEEHLLVKRSSRVTEPILGTSYTPHLSRCDHNYLPWYRRESRSRILVRFTVRLGSSKDSGVYLPLVDTLGSLTSLLPSTTSPPPALLTSNTYINKCRDSDKEGSVEHQRVTPSYSMSPHELFVCFNTAKRFLLFLYLKR